MPFAKRYYVQSTIALLTVGFMVLFGIVGMTIWLGERSQDYFDEVIEARDTRGATVELRNAVQTAEASQRGFLLTNNAIYLAPYETARNLTKRHMATLAEILSHQQDNVIALQHLRSVVLEKFEEMDKTIALKRARRDTEALSIVQTNRGKKLMDEANVFFAGVIRSADDRLTAAVSEQNANANFLRWVTIVGGIVIVVVVAGVATTVRLYTREIQAARDEVFALNTNLENRVRKRTEHLSQANDEIQRFAYIVTHDLRAPLVNIIGFTSELEGSVNSLRQLIDNSAKHDDLDGSGDRETHAAAAADIAEAIGFIRSSTKKMDNLINTILKLSREGQRKLKFEPVDLATVVKASRDAIQHQLSAAQGEIAVRLDAAVVHADRMSLEQVVGNLLENAVKYRDKIRPLRIAVRSHVAPGDRIAIEVSDNGRGIAHQDSDRIFELFRRSGIQDQPGEGIGLAHVRTMVRNLGGDITVASTLGQGTTFNIMLPTGIADPRRSANEPRG